MKIKLAIVAYGGSKKLQIDLTSEKDPKKTVSLNSYYWKDLKDVEDLIKEIEEENNAD